MAVMEWKKDGAVAVITMCNGANRHNPVFARTILNIFDEIEADPQILSIILTSSDEKNFSQGIDVEWLQTAFATKDFTNIKTFMYDMNSVFKRLLTTPVPVVAAINGHAFGNGAILSCACDFRFMSKERGFFCFPEIDLRIPFLPGMIAFIRKAIPEYKFNELALTGKRLTAEELATHHIIEKACDSAAQLQENAMIFARSLTKHRGIMGEMKKRMYKSVVETIDEQDSEFIDTLQLLVPE